MIVAQWSSRVLPAADQFEFVRATFASGPFPMGLERPRADQDGPMACDAIVECFGDTLMAASTRSDPGIGLRGKQEIARTTEDLLWIVEQRSAPGAFEIEGVSHSFQPGDIAYGDSATSVVARGSEVVDYRMWFLPRATLKGLLAVPAGEPSGLISAAAPMHGLLSSFLQNFAKAFEAASPWAGAELIQTLVRLLSIHHGMRCDAADLGRDAVAAARLQQIKDYLAGRLQSHALSPRSVAAAHGMSTRSLHKLFEPTGVSFSRYVTNERLGLARTALECRGARETVADIAFSCGFESMATFYRAFRARYGFSPAELGRARRP